jgi:hypothetical protein
MIKAWMNLAFDSVSLCRDAQAVIGLRLFKLSAGGARANSEARRMVTEKGLAAAQAFSVIAFGGSPEKVLRGYRKAVRANRRRLSRR